MTLSWRQLASEPRERKGILVPRWKSARGSRSVAALTFIVAVLAFITPATATSGNHQGLTPQAQQAGLPHAEAGQGSVPGERQVQADCPAQNFCMFSGTSFTGSQFNLYRCDTYALSNWEGHGSWINNQAPGTRAQFLDQNSNVIYTTPGAYSASSSQDWTPVSYIRNC
ncbi:peptidase inhibitor family I36 protein [Streptomyces telluris]|uniref:Peptidase inhibitor family I36 protein n=1 Tax=Streptomyces telluris TaxID=2720021 RepID=A0A9X2LGH4_9ACTN|nr:peptidase inhibitor family I36 protein [Streptomyces telluris]MCQ8770437.1 peptidase inhibitor family I36 protein [Streptomyces telluris]NJP81518.1 hypothetical protein [Streptomyces telluris]